MTEHQFFGLSALILLSHGTDDKVRTVLGVLALILQVVTWIGGKA
jgi:hypothetical protein